MKKSSIYLANLLCIIAFCSPFLSIAQDCGCTHIIIPAKNSVTFDGQTQNPKVKPGDVLCFNATTVLERIIIKNIVGTKENPIIIKNCGGVAHIKGKDGATYGPILVQYSAHIKMTGTGDPASLYGIKVEGGANGISFSELTTDVEVENVEVCNTGFAGIMAKTDPTCAEPRSWRENFIMYNVHLHHNYIHDVKGEGFYVGNSFYVTGAPSTAACPIAGSTETFKKYAHIIDGVDIHDNIVKRAGCEGIQVGSAPKNCKIHDNVIDTSGIYPFALYQNNGLQIGNGTGGLVYNNFIRFSPGNGISCLGIGDNFLYNNIIIHSGATDSTSGSGIFMDEQATPDSVLGTGMKFINNTIINPKDNGIRIYNDRIANNLIYNNIIVQLGVSPKHIHKLNNNVKTVEKTNLLLTSFGNNLFEDVINDDYRIKTGSIASGSGTDVSSFGITFDNQNKTRLSNDIGAFATNLVTDIIDSPIAVFNPTSFYIYPNPVSESSESISFKFYLEKASLVSVQSFDLSGKHQPSIVNQEFKAGWNEYKILKSTLNSTKNALVFKLLIDGKATESKIVILE